MNTVVIGASIAIKWVIEEDGTAQALALRQRARVMAPELLVAECANILSKKVRLREISEQEARLAARLLQAAAIEFVPTQSLMESATRIAIELDHPAYDCLYLALAIERNALFVTTDGRFLRKLDQGRRRYRANAVSLAVATSEV